MPTFVKCLCLSVAAAGIAAAQWVDVYTTPSSDGTNYYATSFMQVNMASAPVCEEPSNPCAKAIHTYKQTVTITSPSGRQASCSFCPDRYSALTAVNLNCEASLAIDDSPGDPELGEWTIEDQPDATCSIAGTFLDAELWSISHVRIGVTFFQNPTPTSYGCYYTQTACSSGTPSCTGPWGFKLTGGCPEYLYSLFLVVYVDTLDLTICSPSISGATDGPGPCS